jgi:Uma2 family endonuclease
MSNALAHSDDLISVEDYLQGERTSEIRHEYVGGHVYAMAGASDDHKRIAGNIFGELRERLRGKRCEPFMVDMKFQNFGQRSFLLYGCPGCLRSDRRRKVLPRASDCCF